jgi:very-short-patch-repair endonuclease
MSAQADKTPHPSRPLADPPSPSRGEGETEFAARSLLPSPLEGEGAQRADEGFANAKRARTEWRTTKTPVLRVFAKRMRHAPTEAETKLWTLLRNRRFAQYKFRRQLPVGDYVVDFVCLSHKLIIEADGSQHAENLRDTIRDAYLAGQGFRLLRFWNNDILARPISVSDAIWAALAGDAS